MLSKIKLQEFNEKGFTVIKNFISKKQIKSIYSQIDEILSLILRKNNITFKISDTVDQKYLILNKKNPVLKSHFYNSLKLMDSLNSVVFSKKITSTMKKIVNNKNLFVLGQRLRLDHKEDHHHLPLHQELNNISNSFALMWCPLVPVNKITGSLCLIPGSQKYGHLRYKQSNKPAEHHTIGIVEKILNGKENENYNNKIVKDLFKKKNLHFPTLNPGDAIIFTTFMFHGSTPYKGKNIRWSLLSSFIPYDKVPYIQDHKLKKMQISYNVNYNKIDV
tara:strand:- start:140 stop:967 length:828 start_codon:yes stop_codon:yes gene_type:complete